MEIAKFKWSKLSADIDNDARYYHRVSNDGDPGEALQPLTGYELKRISAKVGPKMSPTCWIEVMPMPTAREVEDLRIFAETLVAAHDYYCVKQS